MKIWSCNKFCYDECCSFAGLVRSFYVTLGKNFYSLCNMYALYVQTRTKMYHTGANCTTQEQTVLKATGGGGVEGQEVSGIHIKNLVERKKMQKPV